MAPSALTSHFPIRKPSFGLSGKKRSLPTSGSDLTEKNDSASLDQPNHSTSVASALETPIVYTTPRKPKQAAKRRRNELTPRALEPNLSPSLDRRRKVARIGQSPQKSDVAKDLSTVSKAFTLQGKESDISEDDSSKPDLLSTVYKTIRKTTGSLGGDGSGGAIYGEITMKSFQRVIDYLKENCDLNRDSRFLDIGSGLGKPNFHAAVDPGCVLSYGVELESLRWQLSLHNLKSVSSELDSKSVIFTLGDIMTAKSFDPFSHVYSFDVGFPPNTMKSMAQSFNNSSTAQYVVSFHPPRKIVDTYGYAVEHLPEAKISTSMAGSNESHVCYVYKRNGKRSRGVVSSSVSINGLPVDPMFEEGIRILDGSEESLQSWINDNMHSSGRTRSQRRRLQI